MKAAMETTVYLRGRDSFAAVAFPSAASAAAAAAVVLPAAAAPSAPPTGKFPARTERCNIRQDIIQPEPQAPSVPTKK